ncbi:MAG: hypothetical protein AAF716_01200 [Cyanobacteria bacterium P01_D01_bin.1]
MAKQTAQGAKDEGLVCLLSGGYLAVAEVALDTREIEVRLKM